jgi:hypothetical protein
MLIILILPVSVSNIKVVVVCMNFSECALQKNCMMVLVVVVAEQFYFTQEANFERALIAPHPSNPQVK